MKTQSPNHRSILKSLAYLNKHSKDEVSVIWVNERSCRIVYGQQCIYPVYIADACLLESLVADRLNAIACMVAKIKLKSWMDKNVK